MIAVVISIVVSMAASWLLALIDLRLGSGLGAAAATALVTTLLTRTDGRAPARWRPIAAAVIAGAGFAYLVHLSQQIIGPAWPDALPYAKSTLIAPAVTALAAALSVLDAKRSKVASPASAPGAPT